MTVLRYTARRLLLLVPVLIGVSIATFVLIRILPGDPIRTLVPQTATEADILAARQRYGLDHSILGQYWIYLGNLLHGNLGRSFQTGQPVTGELAQRLGATFELVTCALLLALVVGVAVGIYSALRSGRVGDQLVRFGALVGAAVPDFWLGLILIFVFYYKLGWAPAPSGRLADTVQLQPITHIDLVDAALRGDAPALGSVIGHLVLPVITLAVIISAPIILSVRAAAVQVLASDAYRCAEAHGLSGRVRVHRYLLRETIIGLPTLAALLYGQLIGGAVLVEFVFSWQGVGQWALNGMQSRDYPVVQAFVLVSATVYVFVFLLADIVHAFLDPRVRL